MNAFKLSAVALALVASFSASAMTSIQDADLAQVSGQEGVSIVADLNINIGSFTYTDSGASVSFNNIAINGMMIATIDVLQAGAFVPAVNASVVAQSVLRGGASLSAAAASAVVSAAGAATGYTGQDVVQFAFPQVGAIGSPVSLDARSVTPTITVASMTTGHGGASMGGIQIKNLDLQGTKIWMYGHN
jgi:hypothetical protein